jgi:transposase
VYIRRILIQGAHTILRRIDHRTGPRAAWLRELVARRGKQVAAVALANKNARMASRLISEGCRYDEAQAAA